MDLIAGYAYLDSETVYSKYFPASIGYALANVPHNTFNVFLTHKLGLNVTGGLGGNYVGPRTASSTVPYVPTGYSPQTYASVAASPCAAMTCYIVTGVAMKQVPGYWAFNAMIRRPMTDRIELQANVYNLLNRFFIDQPHPSHLIPAAGVNALMGVNFKF
jgi:catecholate siderophore receptor